MDSYYEGIHKLEEMLKETEKDTPKIVIQKEVVIKEIVPKEIWLIIGVTSEKVDIINSFTNRTLATLYMNCGHVVGAFKEYQELFTQKLPLHDSKLATFGAFITIPNFKKDKEIIKKEYIDIIPINKVEKE